MLLQTATPIPLIATDCKMALPAPSASKLAVREPVPVGENVIVITVPLW
jgi:hypothetical protein